MNRLANYTEEANRQFAKTLSAGYTFVAPLNYLHAFLLDFVQKELSGLLRRPADPRQVVRHRHVPDALRQLPRAAGHRREPGAVRRASCSPDSELGRKLTSIAARADKDRQRAYMARRLMNKVNEQARDLLLRSCQHCVTIGKLLKNVVDDVARGKPQLVLNWSELVSRGQRNLAGAADRPVQEAVLLRPAAQAVHLMEKGFPGGRRAASAKPGTGRPAFAPWGAAESLEELAQLAGTAGHQRGGAARGSAWRAANPFTYVGKGKLAELGLEARAAGAGTLIFDDELTPAQARNIERELGDGLKVLDRTGLILDIFAQHARTREGQIQVELAQYAYLLPRLAGTVDAPDPAGRRPGRRRLRGGPAGTRRDPAGDRPAPHPRAHGFPAPPAGGGAPQPRRALPPPPAPRAVHRRAGRLHQRRQELPAQRPLPLTGRGERGRRTAAGLRGRPAVRHPGPHHPAPAPALRLAGCCSPTRSASSTSCPPSWWPPSGPPWRACEEADLLVHVADASHPLARAQVDTVRQVLSELGVADKPSLLVWNKIDALPGLEPASPAGRRRWR